MKEETVCVVARLRAAPGMGDALAALLVEQAAVVRAGEPGCIAYRLHRSPSDPDAFLFYEAYVDEAALDTHRASPDLARFRQRREREGLVAGAVDVEIFRPLTD